MAAQCDGQCGQRVLERAVGLDRHGTAGNPFEVVALAAEKKERVKAADRRALVARGVEMVVVSMGGEGACFVTEGETVIAIPPEVEVRSTVGAGDAMVAGIVAARLQNLSLGECARLATAFSLDALTRLEPGLSSPEVIAALAKRVALS